MQKAASTFLLLLILVFCSIKAEAAQTPITAIYNSDGSQSTSYLSTPKKSTVDGYSYYPDEIYLPNELNPESYRIHTNYTRNTDACASCHSMHTSVGVSLLQWYSNYETCMACHDGTVTTTYNVAMGTLPNGNPAWAGAFGVGNEHYASYHNVTGGALIGSAPGIIASDGNRNDKPLGCESCHSPHGLGGNARLLNPDPNGIQTVKKKDYENYKLVQIEDDVATVNYAAYPLKDDGSFDLASEPYYMLDGYPYNIKITINGQVYEEGAVYTIDNSDTYTKVKIYKGYGAPDIINTVYSQFIPSLRVKMNITNYLQASETVTYKEGLTKFCSACHGSYKDLQTVSGNAYRHPVNVGVNLGAVDDSSLIWSRMQYKLQDGAKITCLTCHFAHGTSSEFWQRSIGYAENDPKLNEGEGSSALKIAPNSDMCAVCHKNSGFTESNNKTHQDPTYEDNGGMFTQPLGLDNYVGSNLSSCAGASGKENSCHKPIVENYFDSLSGTLHGKSLQAGNGSIDNNISGSEFLNNTDKNVSDIVYVIGTKRTQRYIYVNNGDYLVTKNQYNISNNSWENKAPADFINDCAGCHVTGLDITNKRWSDNGITCEACHGNASNHTTVPSSRNITNPRYLRVADQSDVCGQCHSIGEKEGSQYPYPVGYMPYAEGLNDSSVRLTYQLASYFVVKSPLELPNNFYGTNSPSTTQDSAYAVQEFNDFRQSNHYQTGVISCITCHSSHEPNSQGKMLKLSFEQTCGECHGTSFDIDVVMPKRAQINNNPADNLRVHTFAKQHSTDTEISGSPKLIH